MTQMQYMTLLDFTDSWETLHWAPNPGILMHAVNLDAGKAFMIQYSEDV